MKFKKYILLPLILIATSQITATGYLWQTVAMAKVIIKSSIFSHATLNQQLYQAAGAGNIAEVEALLNLGVDPNVIDYNTNSLTLNSALVLAAENGHTEIVRILLDAQADPNSKSAHGATALMWAVCNQNAEIVRLLINKHADLDAKNRVGQTALRMAVALNNPEIAQALLVANANYNHHNDGGLDILMWAAFIGYKEIVQLLLNAGIDANLQNDNGETALAKATAQGHTEIAQLLENYLKLQKQVAKITPETTKEIAAEIIRNDFVLLLKPILTPEILADKDLMALVVPNSTIERLIKENKAKFINLCTIVMFPQAREDQESKTWDNLPIELTNKILSYEHEIIK